MKRFYLGFFTSGLLIGAVILFNYAVVYMSGEMRTYADVVAAQQEDHSLLYGCIFNNDYVPYKDEIYTRRKPEILVLGSSRTLHYSQSFFNRPFANCGLAINNVRTARRFFDRIGREPYPKTILIGLDPWWFNEGLNDSADIEYDSTGGELTFDKLFTPIKYVFDGKVHFGDVFGNYRSGFAPSKGGLRLLGLRAIEVEGGFFGDGSSLDELEMAAGTAEVRNFAEDGMRLIRRQTTAYHYGDRFRKETIDAFFEGVVALRDRGMRVIVFFSPVYPEYYDYMKKSGNYTYVDRLTAYVRAEFGVYDFLDPASIRATRGDFFDMIHMRKAGYAKLLKELTRREPALRAVVRMDNVESTIEESPLR
jgi:hypothetical protein